MDTAFLAYSALMSLTPGPNNLMLAASGVNHGFKKTLPHILGITLGVSLLLLLVSLAMDSLLGVFGILRPILGLAGCLYLLWLSWKIAFSRSLKEVKDSRPLSLWGAMAFQALNPKVWVMAVNTAVLFVPRGGDLAAGLGLVVACFAAINLASISVWALAGDRLRLLLGHPGALRIFNLLSGALMAATALWLMVEELLPLFAGQSPAAV